MPQRLHVPAYTLFLFQAFEIEPNFASIVSEIWANFQNSIFWAWNLPTSNSSRSCIYTLSFSLSQEAEIELIFALQAAVSQIKVDFQNFSYIWAWNVPSGKFQKLYIQFFPPQGVEIELIFALREAVSEMRADFQNCHIWVWYLAICTYTLFLPTRGWNWAWFRSTGHCLSR